MRLNRFGELKNYKWKTIMSIASLIIAVVGIFTLVSAVNNLNTNNSEQSLARDTFFNTLPQYDPDFDLQFYPPVSFHDSLSEDLHELYSESIKSFGDIFQYIDYSKGASEIILTNTNSNIFNVFASKAVKEAKKEWTARYKVIYNDQIVDDIVISLKDKRAIVNLYYESNKLVMNEFTYIYPADQNIIRYKNSTNELVPVAKGKTKLYVHHNANIYVVDVKVKK